MINRIIWHWTVSGYGVNSSSLKAYHYIIDGDGRVVKGNIHDSGNFAGASMAPGTYAPHTRNLNTGSLGLSVASMYGAKEAPFTTGPYPMKEVQIQALLQLTADKMAEYNVPLTNRTVLSHAEVQPTLGVTQSGKWDYMWLPGMTEPRNSVEIGDILRARLRNIVSTVVRQPTPVVRPTIKRGSRGPDVFALQSKLGVTADYIFGENTEKAVKKFQKENQLLPDGIVGKMTWAALGL